MSETRKIAAILVSDVVGYSRLAGADEERALARLRALRSDLIDPIIAVHRGRVVKRTGDGAIVEFRSVVNCHMGETPGARPIEFFHRSTKPLDVGTILRPRGLLNNNDEIETVFEDARPPGLLSRLTAVFMTGDVRSRLNGVNGSYVYRVMPTGLVEVHDNVWYGEVQKADLKRKHKSNLIAGYPEWRPDVLAAFAERYWTGAASTAPNWEYLASSAEVLELVAGPA
jgi:hypothetical protein